MVIACARIDDNFSGPMPEQGKGDTEENHDDHCPDERNASEMQQDADLQPQFAVPAARCRGRRLERASIGSSIGGTEPISGRAGATRTEGGRCADSFRQFIERKACRKLAGHLPTPLLGQVRYRRPRARLLKTSDSASL